MKHFSQKNLVIIDVTRLITKFNTLFELSFCPVNYTFNFLIESPLTSNFYSSSTLIRSMPM